MTDSRTGYNAVAIGLHWLIFVLIMANWSLGIYMVDLPISPHMLKSFSWHKWVGVTIFLIMILRVAWRISHPPPPLPATVPHWQR
ncbi:MAG: cytochrome b/b6 domain-containing protein, partial [Pseudomonadota bacterium]